ncbi:MAG: tripartite tricarboxylate transporter substrate binding protein [Burkholderiales bacterium]|nr:tripartite tricarboxylate transporter substrate binding protein [Burkholderiales bacterium]
MSARLALLISAAALLSESAGALANYPVKPVMLVVPYSTGGATDLSARNLAQSASKFLGQTIVVVNKPGAAGTLGSQSVRTAAPNGYTLLLARVGAQAIGPAIDSSVPYKWNDFTFLSVLELNPVACVARPDAPFRSLRELTEHLKKNPGKLNFSSSDKGSIPFMTSQVLFSAAGLDKNIAVSVPYKSDADSITALLGDQVQFFCGSMTVLMPQIKFGKLRGLAVAMPERMREIPDVATARESGFPALEKVVGWSALYGPPGLPQDVVRKWSEVMTRVANDGDWITGNANFGGVPAVRSPAETQRFAQTQYEFYNALVTSLGIRD